MVKAFLVVSVLGFSLVSAAQRYEPSIWEELDACSYECSARCNAMTQRLEEKLLFVRNNCSGANPAQNAEVFEQAYKFAYGREGMDLSQADATDFANRITKERNPRLALQAFKDAYTFAYGRNGMDLSRVDATELSWTLIRQRDYVTAVNCFKRSYTFAYSQSGMNLSREGARAQAIKSCGIVTR